VALASIRERSTSTGTGRVRPGEVSRSHCGVLFLQNTL
jgi:predicted ATPase with chaperone activity